LGEGGFEDAYSDGLSVARQIQFAPNPTLTPALSQAWERETPEVDFAMALHRYT
jgi:hypothetical protein